MTQRLSVNSRKKLFVNLIKIGVIQSAKMETILEKAPAFFNVHQPPRAVYPLVYQYFLRNTHSIIKFSKFCCRQSFLQSYFIVESFTDKCLVFLIKNICERNAFYILINLKNTFFMENIPFSLAQSIVRICSHPEDSGKTFDDLKSLLILTLPGRGYRFRALEGGGLNQPPLKNQWRSCVRPQVAI